MASRWGSRPLAAHLAGLAAHEPRAVAAVEVEDAAVHGGQSAGHQLVAARQIRRHGAVAKEHAVQHGGAGLTLWLWRRDSYHLL